MRKKPFIVFVFSQERPQTSTKYAGFAARLKKAGGFPGHGSLTVALENIVFVIDETGGAQAIDAVSGVNIGEAAFVYFKSWEALPEEACALATYLFYKGVPFMDTLLLGVGKSKLATMFRMWGNGIAVPFTVYTHRADRLVAVTKETYGEQLGDNFIVKDIAGAKGRTNFLLTKEDMAAKIAGYPDVQFICQRFVPNEGDYRIGVYAYQSRFVIKRVGAGKSHLNNLSAGGSATYIPVETLSGSLLRLAERASEAAELQISGVDIIVDKLTQKAFILEVNRGSQIVTGAFTEENIVAFNEGLNEVIRGRYERPRKRPARIVGRRANAGLPQLGVDAVVAKIDTGAYSSTLHAENIRIEQATTNESELVFELRPSVHLHTHDGTVQTIRTKEFSEQKIRSSNGHLQDRYSIRTKLSIEGTSFIALVTLSDRSQMGYPLLVGRKALRSRFLVNVELNEDNRLIFSY